jgi:hypothetical protein
MEFEFNLRLCFGIGLLVLPIAQSGYSGFHEHRMAPDNFAIFNFAIGIYKYFDFHSHQSIASVSPVEGKRGQDWG